MPTSRIGLQAGKVSAVLSQGGDLWAPGSYTTLEEGNPISEEVDLFFGGGLWLGGFDPGANLKVAAATYGTFAGNTDFFAGPLSEEGLTTPDNCQNFDRHWSIQKTNIDALVADLADGQLDDPVHPELLIWPAKGNPHFEDFFGFALPNTPQGLAPFIDNDGDGIYDPEKGDLPDTKEADQAYWWVFNDGGGIHTQTTGDPLQMEIQVLAYHYESPDSTINETIYYDYKFINRAIEPIDSFFAAIWLDGNVGCDMDDFIGCDTARNLVYMYNEEADDGGPECGDCLAGTEFCGEVPIIGIKIRKGIGRIKNGQLVDNGLSSFMYYDNLAYNPIQAMVDPEAPLEYYNYMTGSWRDGTPLSYGGTGYSPVGGIVDHAFIDPPNDPTGWSMCTADFAPRDRRLVLGSGPGFLAPGAQTELHFAVFKAYGNTYPCPDLDPLIGACEKIDAWRNNITSTQSPQQLPSQALRVSPNPVQDQMTFELLDATEQLDRIQLYTFDGRLLQQTPSLQVQQWTLSREQLPPGMYLYRIQTQSGKWQSGKLIFE